jgi:hypothetical protein
MLTEKSPLLSSAVHVVSNMISIQQSHGCGLDVSVTCVIPERVCVCVCVCVCVDWLQDTVRHTLSAARSTCTDISENRQKLSHGFHDCESAQIIAILLSLSLHIVAHTLFVSDLLDKCFRQANQRH